MCFRRISPRGTGSVRRYGLAEGGDPVAGIRGSPQSGHWTNSIEVEANCRRRQLVRTTYMFDEQAPSLPFLWHTSIVSDQFLAAVRGLKYQNVAGELRPTIDGWSWH